MGSTLIILQPHQKSLNLDNVNICFEGIQLSVHHYYSICVVEFMYIFISRQDIHKKFI